MSELPAGADRGGVTAVVVTYNRKELLIDCLEALERQTVPLQRVIVVDNASTDGTEDLVTDCGAATRMPLEYLRLRRNGGGSEGFYYGVCAALEGEPEWVWLMDDDCEPAADALECLLASPRAAEASTGALAGIVRVPDGQLVPLHRGHIVNRLPRSPIVALDEDEYAQHELRCGFASFVGPLFRASAMREIGPPPREWFIRFEDLEYSARLRNRGWSLWLVTASEMVHKETLTITTHTLRGYWEFYSQQILFKDQWKPIYGLRNLIYGGRREGYVTLPAALSYIAVYIAHALLFDERPVRTALLTVMYGMDGFRGRFRNVPPPRWAGLARTRRLAAFVDAESLRYDEDVAEPSRPLRRDDRVSGPLERRRSMS